MHGYIWKKHWCKNIPRLWFIISSQTCWVIAIHILIHILMHVWYIYADNKIVRNNKKNVASNNYHNMLFIIIWTDDLIFLGSYFELFHDNNISWVHNPILYLVFLFFFFIVLFLLSLLFLIIFLHRILCFILCLF